MPVPGSAFKAKVLVGREVAFLQTQRDEKQHHHTKKHVKAVEPSQHVKRRTKNAGGQLEVQVGVKVVILVTLNAQKYKTQRHRHPHEGNGFTPVPLAKRMVSDGHRDA